MAVCRGCFGLLMVCLEDLVVFVGPVGYGCLVPGRENRGVDNVS